MPNPKRAATKQDGKHSKKMSSRAQNESPAILTLFDDEAEEDLSLTEDFDSFKDANENHVKEKESASGVNIITPSKASNPYGKRNAGIVPLPFASTVTKTAFQAPNAFQELTLEKKYNRNGTECYQNRVFLIVTKSDDLIVKFCLPRDNKKAPPDYWMKSLMKHPNKEDIAKQIPFHFLLELRSPESPTRFLPNNREGNLAGGPWYCLVNLQYDPLPDEQAVKWAGDIALLATKIDSAGDYDTFYGYAGNLTPPTLQPLSQYLTIDGVFTVLRQKFDASMLSLLNDPIIATTYFDEDSLKIAKKQAQASIRSKDTSSFLDTFTF